MTKDLSCIYLHHADPYLKLGPFKFEQLHIDPEIGLIHQFLSIQESKSVTDLAKGQLRSTPYVVNQKNVQFTKKRTSKVMYMNERIVKEAMVVTKKIEIATKLQLHHEMFASENYKVMNYGIAGKIDPHTDTPGQIVTQYTNPGMKMFTNVYYIRDISFEQFFIFLSHKLSRMSDKRWIKICYLHGVSKLSRIWRKHNFSSGRNFCET